MVARILVKSINKVRTQGFREFLSIIRKNIRLAYIRSFEGFIDFILNVDTGGLLLVDPQEMASTRKSIDTWFEATPWFALNRLLRKLDCDFRNYTLVDFGAGKGRTLLEAARLPFRAVIGVEFSRPLCAIAERNVNSVRLLARRTKHVAVECIDALEFDIPQQSCILYFYNPFEESKMAIIANKIRRAIDRHGIDVIAIFYARNQNGIFHRLDFMKEIDSGHIVDRMTGRRREYSIFRSTGIQSRSPSAIA